MKLTTSQQVMVLAGVVLIALSGLSLTSWHASANGYACGTAVKPDRELELVAKLAGTDIGASTISADAPNAYDACTKDLLERKIAAGILAVGAVVAIVAVVRERRRPTIDGGDTNT